MSISTNCSKSSDIISVSAWKKRFSAMSQPVFKIYLQHCLCTSTGLCRKFQEGGGLISIIAFNIFHYPYLILLEHDTKKQFDCEQGQNKLLLITQGFNSLFMVHWSHKNSVDDKKRGFTRHLMGDCLKGLAQAKIIKNRWFYFGFLIWPYDVNMSID